LDKKIRPVAGVPPQLSSETVLGNERDDGIDAFTEWRLCRLKALEAETAPILSEAGEPSPTGDAIFHRERFFGNDTDNARSGRSGCKRLGYAIRAFSQGGP
jgi:hypothetical protein